MLTQPSEYFARAILNTQFRIKFFQIVAQIFYIVPVMHKRLKSGILFANGVEECRGRLKLLRFRMLLH